MRQRPIAVFDSGVGGISVLRALRRELPSENYLYFGDSANAPYGSRPTQDICRLTMEHAARLLEQSKALVLACNTATSAAIDELRERYPDRIIIGIEPALKPALRAFPEGRIVVMATEATLRERKFAALMAQYAENCHIIKCPCPELVEFVERGELHGAAVERVLREELSAALDPLPDAVVLGCTHFPFLKEAIHAVFGADVRFFDGAEGTARETRRRLDECGLLLPEGTEGEVTLRNSADSTDLTALEQILLNQ